MGMRSVMVEGLTLIAERAEELTADHSAGKADEVEVIGAVAAIGEKARALIAKVKEHDG